MLYAIPADDLGDEILYVTDKQQENGSAMVYSGPRDLDSERRLKT